MFLPVTLLELEASNCSIPVLPPKESGMRRYLR